MEIFLVQIVSSCFLRVGRLTTLPRPGFNMKSKAAHSGPKKFENVFHGGCVALTYDAYISMRLHFSKLWYHLAHLHYPLRHTRIHFSLTPRHSRILPLAFLPCACPFTRTAHCHCAEWQCPNQSGFHLANLNRQPQPDICLMCFCYVGSWLHKCQPAGRKQWL